MDKLNRHSVRIKEQPDNHALSAAKAVQRDFEDLVALFDRQLASLPASDSQARLHVDSAKSAAARGLHLSRKLIESLSD